MVSVELWWLHDDSGRVTPDGMEVAAAFEVGLVKVIGVGVGVADEVRVAGVCARRTCSAICLFLSSTVDK